LMWIQEYAAFPLFGKAGGLPFGVGNTSERAVTMRRTLSALRAKTHNLILFPEGVMHRPPGLLEFGRSLEFLVEKVPDVAVVPVAIRYEKALHERPECYVEFGEPVSSDFRFCLEAVLAGLTERVAAGEPFDILFQGKRDVNERWDLRKWRK
jgi:1-acyl-sn-glycerol-3-phosphate acyltransferase